jgi:hypothetical protein
LIPDAAIEEIWALRINPSDLSNIERPRGEGPATGGGQLYIQVGQRMVPHLLRFLRKPYPTNVPISLTVASVGMPGHLDVVQFDKKSQGRMRIPNQNRYRATRVYAWSPASGFPSLPEDGASTEDAATLIKSLGGLHIFLARSSDLKVWAGYNKGNLDDRGGAFPFAHLLSGNSEGGYWKYDEGPRPS